MEQVHSVKLVEISPASEYRQARSEVIISGEPTGILVDGQVLEAAIKTDTDEYLLFTTDDVMFEEFLTMTLISVRKGMLEWLYLGNEYSSGTFEKLTVKENSIQFSFTGNTGWTIKMLANPQLRIPFLSEPRGVKRSPGLKTRIMISATPA